MLRLVQGINKDIQTANGKFYPKLVLEKINEVIVKCFPLNLENCPIINKINLELQDLAFFLWDMKDKEENSIISTYKIE
jgi:ATP-dependent RNA circularization protein (DNA/RNA ligase family)